MPAQPSSPKITYVETSTLRHIEGFSARRVAWLTRKIQREGRWTKPVVLDRAHHLVMDGQHRMEVARRLGLRVIPAVLYDYAEVEVWSLRPRTHTVSAAEITARSLAGDIYPYKTAKHRFPCGELPRLDLSLAELATRRRPGRVPPAARLAA
jgi:hypothetical protein